MLEITPIKNKMQVLILIKENIKGTNNKGINLVQIAIPYNIPEISFLPMRIKQNAQSNKEIVSPSKCKLPVISIITSGFSAQIHTLLEFMLNFSRILINMNKARHSNRIKIILMLIILPIKDEPAIDAAKVKTNWLIGG